MEIYIKPQFNILFYILYNIICSLLLLKNKFNSPYSKQFNQNKKIQKKAKIVHKNKGLNEQLKDIIMKKRYETLVHPLFKKFCTCVSCISVLEHSY